MIASECRCDAIEMPRSGQRIEWIDWAKIIGIWLVVVGHMQHSEFVTNFIYSFHIPLFFFVSGFLAKPESVLKTIAIGFRKLLIPYVIFYLAAWIWWFFVSYLRYPNLFDHNHPMREILVKPFLGLLFGVGYSTDISTMINVPIWFLMGLFATTILFSATMLLSKRVLVIIVTVLLAGFAYVLSRFNLDLLFSLDSALMALPFYVAGYYLHDNIVALLSRKQALKQTFLLILVMMVTLFLTLAMVQINGRTDINMLYFGHNPLLSYCNGFAGIALIIVTGTLLAKWWHNKYIVLLSNGTILIMGTERIVSGTISFAFRFFAIETLPGMNLLRATLVIILCLPLIVWSERKIPLLIGKRAVKDIAR